MLQDRTRLVLVVLVLCAPLIIAWGVPRGVASAIKRGNEAYGQAKYDDALREYAGIEDPGSAEHIVRFNSGDALFKKQNHKAAIEEYQRALGAGSAFDAQAHYNMGNAAFRMGKLDDAIAGYKRALELDPTDTWAKHNLEFALRQKQEQEQQQQQPNPEQKQEQTEKSEGEKQQTKPEPAQEKQQPAGEKQAGEPMQRALTQAEALRLLRAAADDDKAVQRQILRMKLESIPEQTPDKDW